MVSFFNHKVLSIYSRPRNMTITLQLNFVFKFPKNIKLLTLQSSAFPFPSAHFVLIKNTFY